MKKPLQVALSARRMLRWRIALLATVLLGLIALSMAWGTSSFKSLLDLNRVVSWLQNSGLSVGTVVAAAGFAAASVFAVPLIFLTLVSLVAFGSVKGFFVATIGAAAGAFVTFTLGKLLGHAVVVRLGGTKVNMISERLARHGIWAVIAIRMVPIAPFAIINLIAGSTHLRLRDMLVGTVLGMTPGTLAMAVFIDQILDALKRPGPVTLVLPLLFLVLITMGALGARKWVKSMDRQKSSRAPQQDI